MDEAIESVVFLLGDSSSYMSTGKGEFWSCLKTNE
jgi:hypothetical protein